VSEEKKLKCALCEIKKCREGKDCFEKVEQYKKLYDNGNISRLHKAASAIEARYYCKEPRLREIIFFAKELGCKKIGLAFCIGLSEEAKIIEQILSGHFQVESVCCKACGIDKKTLGLEQINANDNEVMCNPAGQAELLNEAQTELNILCGLCVGHDAVFTMLSKAPVTTIIVKDRVLAHNPAGVVYSKYIRNTFK
jgi:uncharacterized metal-binding protein